MKEYLSAESKSRYQIPSLMITNEAQVWDIFIAKMNGNNISKVEGVISEFLLKVSALTLAKIYPMASDELFDQDDKFIDLYNSLMAFYFFGDIKGRVYKYFKTPPFSPDEKALFRAHFINKAVKELSTINRKNGLREEREMPFDLWEDVNHEILNRSARKIDEKRKGKKPAKPIEKINLHPQEMLAEEKIVLADTIDEVISNMPQRKLEGKKIGGLVEEIYRRREWDKKQLVSFWGAIAQLESKKLLEDYFDDNHEFLLDSLILPIEDKLLIVPKFLENEHLDAMWKIYLSGKLPKKPEISDEDRNAVEAIRRKG